VIRADVGEDGVVLVADLPPGSLAYIDSDWLTTSSSAVPSIVVSRDGMLSWCEGPGVPAPSGVNNDTAAALVLMAVAREGAAAVEGLGPVEVNGSGLIARRLRRLLGEAAAGGDGWATQGSRPAAIVETTGDPAAILESTRRVADLGTVVLVGEGLSRQFDLNLYTDVHVRGLTLLGVAPPIGLGGLSETDIKDPAVRWCCESLVRARPETLLPSDAAWYAVTPRRVT
jgi:hypothetical protein